MAIAVDRWESKDIVLTGSKDHYIKVGQGQRAAISWSKVHYFKVI